MDARRPRRIASTTSRPSKGRTGLVAAIATGLTLAGTVGTVALATPAQAATSGALAFTCRATGVANPMSATVTTSVDDTVNATGLTISRTVSLAPAAADALRAAYAPASLTATAATPFSMAGKQQTVQFTTPKTTIAATGGIDLSASGTATTVPGDVAITTGDFTMKLLLDKGNGTPATAADLTCQAPTPSVTVGTVFAAATSTTALSFNPTKGSITDTVQAIAKVTTSAGAPNGVVAFTVGGTKTNVAVDPNGVATLTLPKPTQSGAVQVKADFLSNDPHYDNSTTTSSFNYALIATKTVLQIPQNSVKVGDMIQATATVALVNGTTSPTGQVEFLIGQTRRVVALAADGTAKLSIPATNAGAFTVYANYLPANSAAVDMSTGTAQLTVAQQPTTTTLIAPTTLTVGASPTISAKVVHANGTTPVGNVIFTVAGKATTVAVKADGTATLALPPLTKVGTLAMTAAYRPADSRTFANSQMGLSGTVAAAAPTASTTTISFSQPTASVGDAVRVTAKVTGGTTAPAGTVDFTVNGQLFSAALGTDGTATVSLPPLQSAGALATTAVFKPAAGSTIAGSTGTSALTVATTATTTEASAEATYRKAGKGKAGNRRPVRLLVSGSVDTANNAGVSGTATVSVKGPGVSKSVNAAVVQGNLNTSLPISKRGTYTVTISYAGAPNVFEASASSKISVRVR